MTVYDFEVTDGDGNAVSLSQYEGKVLLIVNSATKCGFTPQYTQLIKLPRLVEAVDFLELFWKSTSLIDNGP